LWHRGFRELQKECSIEGERDVGEKNRSMVGRRTREINPSRSVATKGITSGRKGGKKAEAGW